MHFTLLQGGTFYTPARSRASALLIAGSQIAKVGVIDPHGLAALEDNLQVIDCSGCVVTPGFIDPHAHIIGAGGEQGFASRMPEILFSQIVRGGVTTIVGLLGTDTTTRHIASLHAKASQLWDEGLTAYMYTGGFELPPTTLTSSVLDDLVLIDKIIGTGEIAVSDHRWIDPPLHDLAHVVAQTALGGKMSGRAGVSHFHVGPGDNRLGLLHDLLDHYDVPAETIYATHVNRSEALIDDAIRLTRRGGYVDMDTVEEDLPERLAYYRAQGGPMDRITASSDAHTPKGSVRKLHQQFCACVNKSDMPLADMLPLLTRNPATVLKLEHKGRLEPGCDADVLVLHAQTLEIVHLFARGRHVIEHGRQIVQSKQEEQVAAGNE